MSVLKSPSAEPAKNRAKPSTKHSLVAKTIRDEVESGIWPEGARIPSEQEIAKRFGVAYMTARQAVTSLVSEKILERIARKGTFVARQEPGSLKAMGNQFILLLEGGKTTLDPYYLPPIIEAMSAELSAAGFELVIHDYNVSIREGLLPKDAVICCILLSEPELLYANLLQERGNKVLAINRCDEHRSIPYLAPDNQSGAFMAVEHLIQLGHQKIGLIRGLPDNIDAADRRRGYVQAMKKHGLAIGPELGDNFIENCGYDVAKQLLREPNPPTALFCASDLSAIGAMKAIVEEDLKVPEDFSVVGFGDFPLARFWHPGLTTVHLPLAELGTNAARSMMKLSAGEPVASQLLPCEVVLRSTTAALEIRAETSA